MNCMLDYSSGLRFASLFPIRFHKFLGSQSWYPNCNLDRYKMEINVLEQYEYSEFSLTLSLFSKLHAVVFCMITISKYYCLHIYTDICPIMALEMGENTFF
jgi:hypothetical protein